MRCAVLCCAQEEYLLNQPATMRLVGRLAKAGGVKGVADAVYPYLSLAAETFLGQLLNNMVKMRLQREDMGRCVPSKLQHGQHLTDCWCWCWW